MDKELPVKISTLHITTFHSSKGLEFDTVVIPDFEEYERYFTDFTKMAKEQCKALYVAITRAKKNLYFISNKEISFLKDADTYEVIRQNNVNIYDEIPF